MPIAKIKCKTNENSSRVKKQNRKTNSKDRTGEDRSIERNSIQLDKFYNPNKQGYDNSEMILVTPRSFN